MLLLLFENSIPLQLLDKFLCIHLWCILPQDEFPFLWIAQFHELTWWLAWILIGNTPDQFDQWIQNWPFPKNIWTFQHQHLSETIHLLNFWLNKTIWRPHIWDAILDIKVKTKSLNNFFLSLRNLLCAVFSFRYLNDVFQRYFLCLEQFTAEKYTNRH